jgi:hypothetical protein
MIGGQAVDADWKDSVGVELATTSAGVVLFLPADSINLITTAQDNFSHGRGAASCAADQVLRGGFDVIVVAAKVTGDCVCRMHSFSNAEHAERRS